MDYTKVIICFLLCMPGAVLLRAQEDTLLRSVVTLQEVIVQQDGRLHNSRERKQGADLQVPTDQLLEKISGVNMIRRGNYAWEPAIRGLNAGQINVTISGMAIFGACTDRMDPASSYIEPNNLKSVAVSYGTNNESYGSTIGGGFNFKLKQPRLNSEKRFSGLAGLGFESNADALQTLAALEYSSKNFAVRGNGIFRKAGNYAAGGGSRIDNSQYAKWNGGLSAVYRFSDHHFIYTDYIQDEGWDIGYPALLMDVAFARAKIASVAYRYQPHSKNLHHWETKLYFNTIDHAMDDTKRPKDQVPVHMDMPGTSRTTGFYSEALWTFDNAHHLTVRLNGYRNRLHAEMTMYPEGAASMFMLTIPDAQRDVAGLDISHKMHIGQNAEIVAGARADYTGSSLYSAEGKQLFSGMHLGNLGRSTLLYNIYLNGAYRMNNHAQLFAGVARAMRSATLQEMYGFYLFNRSDGFDYIGNPGLKNEASCNLSTGARFRKSIVAIEGQVFAYFFQHYIAGMQVPGYSAMTYGARGVKRYGNISSAVLYGAEANIEVKPLSVLTLKSSNTYIHGQDVNSNALPLIAPFKSVNTLSVNWKEYRFTGEYEYAAAQRHISSTFYGELSSPSYTIVNLAAGKSIPIKSTLLDLSISLTNLFDRNYYTHLDILKIPRLGRNLTVHLTLQF